ncbi:MAG TPA: carboxypeptidase regulatory-like domain-containing protein, partial [Longimicrobiales bacterium]|nr:carboxypeptidase regulatory-like domain-containing protein [Longimicrobiales bacterium]
MSGRSSSVFLALMVLVTLGPAPAAAQGTERLYQEACDGGDLTACNVFGLMYETGQGVPHDLLRAAALYQRACEGGELIGCTNVGLLYVTGVGLAQDSARAAGFFRIACEGGDELGCGLMRALAESTSTPVERYDKAGRVGDAGTNRALSDAIVELPELGIRMISDTEGRFVLADVPAGRHTVRAERLGYEQLVGTVEIPGNPEFVMLMTPTDVDPAAAGQIVGQVVDENGRGLQSVEVVVVGQERARALSNRQGRFTLRDVEPGPAAVRFALIGRAPRTVALVVQPGRTAEVSATMTIEPIELEPIEVSIRSLTLERAGFYDRARRGWGRHFTPGDLERIQPTYVSDIFRGVPGVRVSRVLDRDWGYVTRVISARSSSFLRGPCVLPLYLDGMQVFGDDIEIINAGAIAAAEVYVGAGTPMQ